MPLVFFSRHTFTPLAVLWLITWVDLALRCTLKTQYTYIHLQYLWPIIIIITFFYFFYFGVPNQHKWLALVAVYAVDTAQDPQEHDTTVCYLLQHVVVEILRRYHRRYVQEKSEPTRVLQRWWARVSMCCVFNNTVHSFVARLLFRPIFLPEVRDHHVTHRVRLSSGGHTHADWLKLNIFNNKLQTTFWN